MSAYATIAVLCGLAVVGSVIGVALVLWLSEREER